MFKILMFKGLQIALCQLYGFCLSQPECPDGVCDEAMDAIDNINVPDPAVTPGKVQAFDIGDIDWSKLKEVSDAVVALITALKSFFGMNRVGT